jgi:pimeloyl-ACP methyl ester carboxylesterase
VEYGYRNQQLPAGYSVKTESNALDATIHDLGVKEPVDFVAWSYGADVTLDFAIDHPRLVRTLTLIEPPALWVLKANGSAKFFYQITDILAASFSHAQVIEYPSGHAPGNKYQEKAIHAYILSFLKLIISRVASFHKRKVTVLKPGQNFRGLTLLKRAFS